MAKGQKTGGRQVGTPNKVTASIKDAATQYSDEALATLAAVMKNESEPATARVAAANAILDRAHGKPKQSMDIDANVKAAISAVRRTIVDPRAA